MKVVLSSQRLIYRHLQPFLEPRIDLRTRGRWLFLEANLNPAPQLNRLPTSRSHQRHVLIVYERAYAGRKAVAQMGVL